MSTPKGIRTRRATLLSATTATAAFLRLRRPGGAPGRGEEAGEAAKAAPGHHPLEHLGGRPEPLQHHRRAPGPGHLQPEVPQHQGAPEIQEGGSATWGPKLVTGWLGGRGGHHRPLLRRQPGLLPPGLHPQPRPLPQAGRQGVPTQDYVDWLMKLFNSKENGQFALPMYTGTIALMYNRRRFQERGIAVPDDTWDWNKYRDVAMRIAEPEQKLGPRRRRRGIDVPPLPPERGQRDRPPGRHQGRLQLGQGHRGHGVREGGDAEGPLGGAGGGAPGPRRRPRPPRRSTCRSTRPHLHVGGGAFTLTRYVTMLNEEIDWEIAPCPRARRGASPWPPTTAGASGRAPRPRTPPGSCQFLQSDEWTDIATRVAGQQSARRSHQQRWLTSIKEANPKLAGKNLVPFTDAIEKGYARPIEFWRKDADLEEDLHRRLQQVGAGQREEVGGAMKGCGSRSTRSAELAIVVGEFLGGPRPQALATAVTGRALRIFLPFRPPLRAGSFHAGRGGVAFVRGEGKSASAGRWSASRPGPRGGGPAPARGFQRRVVPAAPPRSYAGKVIPAALVTKSAVPLRTQAGRTRPAPHSW